MKMFPFDSGRVPVTTQDDVKELKGVFGGGPQRECIYIPKS